MRYLLFAIIFPGAFFSKTFAQNHAADSSFGYAINKNIQLYNASRGSSLNLYNGVEYVFQYQKVAGTPFFLVNTLQENNIVYDGTLYQHVPLAYDLADNQLVTQTPDNFYIQLIPEKINSFTISNHLFTQLTAADVVNTVLTPGFYDVTINDAATVLIKHEKVVMHSSRPEEPDHFNEYNYYYLKIGTTFYAIKSSKALLNILHNKSNEIKAFLHQNKLNFKKNPEQTLIRTAEYYAQLKK